VPSANAGEVRAIVGGTIGNLVEYFDWYVYSSAAIYFAPVFFPKADATAQLMSLGAWYFGRMADRVGRRVALTRSVLLMAAGSLLIAVSPGYAQIGLAAPAVLLVVIGANRYAGGKIGGLSVHAGADEDEVVHRNSSMNPRSSRKGTGSARLHSTNDRSILGVVRSFGLIMHVGAQRAAPNSADAVIHKWRRRESKTRSGEKISQRGRVLAQHPCETSRPGPARSAVLFGLVPISTTQLGHMEGTWEWTQPHDAPPTRPC
jgi:hypothetical protein